VAPVDVIVAALSEHSFEPSGARHGAGLIHAAPSGETSLEHVHLIMDAVRVDDAGRQASENVSSSFLWMVLYFVIVVVVIIS